MYSNTFKTKKISQSDLVEKWFLIDAEGKRIGALASKIAELLLGKSDPMTREYLLPATKVVVINAEKVDATERKRIGKVYTHYTGYPGGLREETLDEVLKVKPKKALERAIKGMLPKNKRGKAIFSSNLYVYADANHFQQAQNPQAIDINSLKL
jgi:large subunit ribosomal protein L13